MWRPVPRPIDEAMPSASHHNANAALASKPVTNYVKTYSLVRSFRQVGRSKGKEQESEYKAVLSQPPYPSLYCTGPQSQEDA